MGALGQFVGIEQGADLPSPAEQHLQGGGAKTAGSRGGDQLFHSEGTEVQPGHGYFSSVARLEIRLRVELLEPK